MNISVTDINLTKTIECEWKIAHENVRERGDARFWTEIYNQLSGIWNLTLYASDFYHEDRKQVLDDISLLKSIAFEHRHAYLREE